MPVRSLDCAPSELAAAALRWCAGRGPPSCSPGPPSFLRRGRLATGIIWHYFVSCATVQMFFAEELLSFLTHFGNEAVYQRCSSFSDPWRIHFLLGFLTTCGQCFIYPDVRNNSHEQPSYKAGLTSWQNPMWRPRGAYALINVNISEVLVLWCLWTCCVYGLWCKKNII